MSELSHVHSSNYTFFHTALHFSFSLEPNYKPNNMADNPPKSQWTQDAKARVMSSEAQKHGGGVPKGNWAAGGQSRADKNTAQGK